MTGDLLIDSVISLGAIAVMVATAWALFREPAEPVSERAARERLAFDEPDFNPITWLADGKGRALLAEGDAGDFALALRVGRDLVTRRFSTALASAEDGVLIIRLGEAGLAKVEFSSAQATIWAGKLNATRDI